MPYHAGFAAAMTVREHVFKTALQAAYANGAFPKVFTENLQGPGPGVRTNLFLDQPDVSCEGTSGLLVLSIATWGSLTVTIDDIATDVNIMGDLEVTIVPVFTPESSSLKLSPVGIDIVVRRWNATVTSEGAPADVISFVAGEGLRVKIEETLRLAVLINRIPMPSLDASFFGPLAGIATSVVARVEHGVLLLGLNIENDRATIIGRVNDLVDFAFTHSIAGVVNAEATILLLDELHTLLITEIEKGGATLDSGFSIRPERDYYQVSGTASKTGGNVDFSFRIVRKMTHGRPGKVFTYLPKTRRVNPRVWPALEFKIENVETDVDRSWWVIAIEVLLGIVTLGGAAAAIEGFFYTGVAESFSGKIKSSSTRAPVPRVRKTIPPKGGVSVRIGLDEFEITPDGTSIGISIRPTSSPLIMLGPVTVPQTYINDDLRYIVQLPSGVSVDDPTLHIKWRLEDNNNIILREEFGLAATKLKFEFSPSTYPGISDFRVVAIVYREFPSGIHDLGISSLNVHLREPLAPGTYVRWRSDVTNPQIALDEPTETWNYRGEVRVHRWSEWHRTDKPCLAVNATARYRFDHETADRLPFDLHLLENHRKGLCPYCFYGGPGGVNPKL